MAQAVQRQQALGAAHFVGHERDADGGEKAPDVIAGPARQHAQPLPVHFTGVKNDRRLVSADQPGTVGIVGREVVKPVFP
ncbi:MAG: hypothetical protein ABWY64_21020 [Tardiphaga sp.]